VQDCDRLESNIHSNIFTCSSSSYFSQEGKHYWSLPMIFSADFSCNKPTIPVVSFVATNLLHDSNDKHLMHFDNVCPDMLPILWDMTWYTIGNMVIFLLINILICFIFATPFSFVLCRLSFKYNRSRGRLFFKRGRMMKTWHPCIRSWLVHGMEYKKSNKGV
jgi:hypothetical protein